MAHSRTVIYVHCVWSTHRRRNLVPQKLLSELWSYFVGIGRNKRIPVLAAGGMPNHVHLAISLPPTKAVAEVISTFKANSSRWLKQRGVRGFEWPTGYGAFSFGMAQLDQVRRYIDHQEEHHKKSTYEEEFLDMLRRAGIEFDPNDVFD